MKMLRFLMFYIIVKLLQHNMKMLRFLMFYIIVVINGDIRIRRHNKVILFQFSKVFSPPPAYV